MICAWQKKRKYKNAENALDFPQMRIYHKATINADRPEGDTAFIYAKSITRTLKSQGGANTERIRELRLQRNIGQAELARRIGVTPAAVLQMESPGCWPTADKIPAIADAIGCSIDALYGREEAARNGN